MVEELDIYRTAFVLIREHVGHPQLLRYLCHVDRPTLV